MIIVSPRTRSRLCGSLDDDRMPESETPCLDDVVHRGAQSPRSTLCGIVSSNPILWRLRPETMTITSCAEHAGAARPARRADGKGGTVPA